MKEEIKEIDAMVEDGKLLNYDSCIQNPKIWSYAASSVSVNDEDDKDLKKTRNRLCSSYYNSPYEKKYPPNFDDRKGLGPQEWTVSMKDQFTTRKKESVITINNLINEIKGKTISAASGSEASEIDIRNAKSSIDFLINQLIEGTQTIISMTKAIERYISGDLFTKAEKAEKSVKKLKNENNKYSFTSRVRKEQTKALYKKYESNFHSSSFWYMPFHENSRPALLFSSYFFGFLSLILIGIVSAIMITHTGVVAKLPGVIPKKALIPKQAPIAYPKFNIYN